MRLSGGIFDRVNEVVLPLPVNVSTSLSEESKVTVLVANTCAQNMSVDAGAVENIRLPKLSTPNPVEGVAVSCGCCMTPLIDIQVVLLS